MKTLVAVSQLCSGSEKSENLDRSEEIIRKAHSMGVKFLGLPENFAFLGMDEHETFSAAEAIEGPSIERLRDCAKKLRIWLSLGGFPEKIPGRQKIYNTHLVINERGDIVAIYRKLHLFSVKLPDGTVFDEAKSVEPGSGAVLFDAPFFRGGLSICYDVRFAHLYTVLRNRGAEVILVPAAFSSVTGPVHWEVMLRARAIETQSYVLAAAQTGRHNVKRASHGHAMIVDPWGTVLAQCGLVSDLALAEIDLSLVKKLREEMPVWQHRQRIDESQ